MVNLLAFLHASACGLKVRSKYYVERNSEMHGKDLFVYGFCCVQTK